MEGVSQFILKAELQRDILERYNHYVTENVGSLFEIYTLLRNIEDEEYSKKVSHALNLKPLWEKVGFWSSIEERNRKEEFERYFLRIKLS